MFASPAARHLGALQKMSPYMRRLPVQCFFSSGAFAAAQERVKQLPKEPGTDEKLQLYALFKQATVGPNTAPKPSMLDFVGGAKWSAWAKLGSLTKPEAEARYAALVDALAGPPTSTPAAAPAPAAAAAAAAKGAFAPILTSPMLPAGTFKGRVALVTGGGTGLGLAMATQLSRLGAVVGIASRRADVLAAAAARITGETGGLVVPTACDVRDAAAVAGALDALSAAAGGPPTLVVNNAAGNFISPYEHLSPNAIKSILDIVLAGTAYVTLEAGKRMIAAGKGGCFLNITTTYAPAGSGYVAPSAMAKAGVHALTGSLAAEWGAKHGIRFVGLAPGPIETEGAFSRLDPTGKFKGLLTERLPAQRLGDPGELANLATYLLSDYASWMSGQTVVLDGGEKAAMGGEFNALSVVTEDQWAMMKQLIKKNAK
jgi:2,4-dienoyl-CoA reductase